MEAKRSKTYKREAAALALALWSAITIKLFWYTSPELVTAFNGPYSTLTMAMMGIFSVAVGLEWYNVQSPFAKDKTPNV